MSDDDVDDDDDDDDDDDAFEYINSVTIQNGPNTECKPYRSESTNILERYCFSTVPVK